MRWRKAQSILILVALAASLASAGSALADGDPASDMLITESLFYPILGAKIPSSELADLDQMLLDSQNGKFPLKVAVIATRFDLGSVPSLYRHPAIYAKFLGEEDQYYWKSELLVVMPNGYGLYKTGTSVPVRDRAAVAKLAIPNTTDSTTLVADAETAVRALAAQHGVTIGAVNETGRRSTKTQDQVEIGVGAIVLAVLGYGAYFLWKRRTR